MRFDSCYEDFRFLGFNRTKPLIVFRLFHKHSNNSTWRSGMPEELE